MIAKELVVEGSILTHCVVRLANSSLTSRASDRRKSAAGAVRRQDIPSSPSHHERLYELLRATLRHSSAAEAGLRGEWSVGSVLIAEIVQARHRGRWRNFVLS
jgi:hypothetical protein